MEEINADWLRQHLNKERGAQAALARATGISTDHLSKILAGKRMVKAAEAVRIYNYFFPSSASSTPDPVLDEVLDLWSQLTPEERDFLRNAAKAQIAARDSVQS